MLLFFSFTASFTVSAVPFLSHLYFVSVKMDRTQPVQPSLNSSYLPSALGNHCKSDDEESEDQSPSASLIPKHSPAPLPARYSPEDSFCLVYIIFFLMGIGSLLPWNFFITAKQYWLYKLSNNTRHGGDEEQRSDLSVSEQAALGLLCMYVVTRRSALSCPARTS